MPREKFVIVGGLAIGYAGVMLKTTPSSKRVKSDEQLLDQGIAQLLGSIKQHAAAKNKPLKRDQLLKEGYSERFIAKLEQA